MCLPNGGVMLLRILLTVIFVAGSINAFAMGKPVQSVSADNDLIGKQAPDLSLPSSDGTVGSIMSARQGGKAMLIFWATWCPHCREELESVQQQLAAFNEAGIKVILVNSGESREEVIAYLNNRQINLPSFIDEENALQEPYQLVGIPTVVLIAEDGTILTVSYGIPADYQSIFIGVWFYW